MPADKPLPVPAPGSTRLPHPRAPIDARVDPFVGNAGPDDNLRECVQVALWTALGDFSRSVHADVADGHVTLAGTLPSQAHQERAIAALSALRGVDHVIADIETGPPAATVAVAPQTGLRIGHAPAVPMVAVRRYCSLDEASVSAAIKQAGSELRQFVALAEIEMPTDVFIVYRNRQPHTITLEIGLPVDAAVAARAAGDLHATTSPGGTYLEKDAEAGMAALLEAESALDAIARRSGATSRGYAWEMLPICAIEAWQGHPRGAVRLALDTPPHTPAPRSH